MANEYTPVIGMEIHVELKTNSKMFCGCKNDPFHAPNPNIYTCPVCLGMPGALPVANKKAVEWTILLGLALDCTIPLFSKFDRKNYFYPDLAKGYQISQYDEPFCLNGKLSVPGGDVRIRRVHLEEDTGKLQHTTLNGENVSLVDFNRCGVPLVEIVTEPDIRDGEHAKAFLKALHQIVRALDISGADMEKGSMRLEPNISVRKPGQTELPAYKVEVKNINSFNFVKKAIEFEVKRHTEILRDGKLPDQETRGFNEAKGITVSQRKKEEANDYRYFPDPDLPPMRWTDEYIASLRKQLPELPQQMTSRFIEQYGIKLADAQLLTEAPEKAAYFELCVFEAKQIKNADGNLTPIVLANWLLNRKLDWNSLKPREFVMQIMQSKTPTVSSDQIEAAVNDVLVNNPKAIADYRAGKEAALMFLLGQTLRVLKGTADKQQILDLLKRKLSETN